jgi:hypothetical protein
MRKLLIIMLLAIATGTAWGKKEKPVITIEVVGTDAWVKDIEIHHRATSGTATTDCSATGNVNGTATTYGNTTNINGTSTADTECHTTSRPGQPAYTSHTYIQQEYVHAIMPDGQHVTMWCQAGFRKCANLAAGSYQAEADGDKALRLYVRSLVTNKLMGKMKYRIVGTW